jgi:hypothetical protein
MGKARLYSIGLAAACMMAPAMADSRFNIARMTRNDVPAGKAQCDIRLQVDDQVEVVVDGDRVYIHTLSGLDARDDGSECNVPLPGREVPGFNFEVKDSRGDIRLVEAPSRRNGGRAIVRIRDSQSGFGRYHFRLSWAMDGYVAPAPPPPPIIDRPPVGDRRDDDRRDYYRGDLRIINAVWGIPGRNREVTRLLQDRMREGRLRIRATNEEIGFDPALGAVKALRVVYEIRGRRQEVRVAEGDYLELP